MRHQRIVILTGAGISAESGLGTFRDAEGLWAQHRIEDVATPDGFRRDPDLVHGFYNARREQAAAARPNAAHIALAALERDHGATVHILTQNVDDLHERAGSQKVLHMHGQLAGALCAACAHRWPAPDRMRKTDACPHCHATATRPDVVWFGEIPHDMERIGSLVARADLFVAIGTSGEVYPAAGLVQEANAAGARTLELNLAPSSRVSDFGEARFGKATEIVPQWVAEELAG